MQIERKGDNLVITVNLKSTPRPSSTGKSLIVETTSGYTGVQGDGGFKVSVNVTAPIPLEFGPTAAKAA